MESKQLFTDFGKDFEALKLHCVAYGRGLGPLKKKEIWLYYCIFPFILFFFSDAMRAVEEEN